MNAEGQNNRVSFKVGRILINGVEPTNTKVTNITSYFNLIQCFCSCSIMYLYDYTLPNGRVIEVEEHYDDCPNADPERFVKYVNT